MKRATVMANLNYSISIIGSGKLVYRAQFLPGGKNNSGQPSTDGREAWRGNIIRYEMFLENDQIRTS